MSRLAPTANIDALFAGVLPVPKIRSVNLKLSPLPPPINNPHIDHKREYMKAEMVQENLVLNPPLVQKIHGTCLSKLQLCCWIRSKTTETQSGSKMKI